MKPKKLGPDRDSLYPKVLSPVFREIYEFDFHENYTDGFNFASDVFKSVEQIIEIFTQEGDKGVPRLENRMPYKTRRGTHVERESTENKYNLTSGVSREISDRVEFTGLEVNGSIFDCLNISRNSIEPRESKDKEQRFVPQNMSLQFFRAGGLPFSVILYIDSQNFQAHLEVSDRGKNETYNLLATDDDVLERNYFTYREYNEYRPELTAEMILALNIAQQTSVSSLTRALDPREVLIRRSENIKIGEPYVKRQGMFSKFFDRITGRNRENEEDKEN